MYKANLTCADVQDEPCCTRDDKLVFGNVWSMARKDGSDYLLTNSLAERNALTAGGAWREQCSPIANPSAFCVDPSEKDGRAGPFILYNTSAITTVSTRPLFRCSDAAGEVHFFSIDPACEGGFVQGTLGYIATRPGLEMLRALRRCKGTTAGTRFHALDLACDSPDGDGTPLGYVR
jgi:hypothetical protein